MSMCCRCAVMSSSSSARIVPIRRSCCRASSSRAACECSKTTGAAASPAAVSPLRQPTPESPLSRWLVVCTTTSLPASSSGQADLERASTSRPPLMPPATPAGRASCSSGRWRRRAEGMAPLPLLARASRNRASRGLEPRACAAEERLATRCCCCTLDVLPPRPPPGSGSSSSESSVARSSRGSVNELSSVLPPAPALPLLLRSSLTRYAYRRVLSECSTAQLQGETFAIITVLQLLPTKESFSTCVSLEPRNGVWSSCWSSARMHSLRASRDLLISAPSIRVCRSVSRVSAPRSLPAKSMKDTLPCSFSLPSSWIWLSFSVICRIACEREESTLAPVTPVVRLLSPNSMTSISSWTFSTGCSWRPTMTTFCLAFSRACRSWRLFSKSNNLPQ
mmetsp:Transcript_2344/g.6614  ORF Transcript_2344/g.6614 Transcript_2344/m.6614 type:complete len:393 (-) Transcript_2344:982-2160(-)